MSYILEPDRPQRGPLPVRLAALCAIFVIAVALGVFLMGRAHRGHATDAAAAANVERELSWSAAGPWPVPASTVHGPFHTSDGLASGFSHDALGAALAAFNITYRLTSDVSPTVYETTARTQTFGDPEAMLALIRLQPVGGSAPATQFFYRILTGDPTGDSVLVSIAVRSPDSSLSGGFFAAQRSLRWIDGDWHMAVPMPPSATLTALPGYQPLGGPHV
jgi:hypothetical protein